MRKKKKKRGRERERERKPQSTHHDYFSMVQSCQMNIAGLVMSVTEGGRERERGNRKVHPMITLALFRHVK